METGEAGPQDAELLAALDFVKQQMESSAKPGAAGVAAAASGAREALAAWFDGAPGIHERHQFRSWRLGQVVASAAGKRNTVATWESAVQFYLAAVAARESWPGGWNGPPKDVADRLQHGLRYPDLIDVSRYAKHNGNAPTLNRAGAMSLGIELAGWLGPVQPEMIFDEQDVDVTQEDRRRLNELIDEINARWEQRRQEQQAAEGRAREADAEAPEAPPRRAPKTAEELLQERERAGNTPD
jgi:hypothetical protein